MSNENKELTAEEILKSNCIEWDIKTGYLDVTMDSVIEAMHQFAKQEVAKAIKEKEVSWKTLTTLFNFAKKVRDDWHNVSEEYQIEAENILKRINSEWGTIDITALIETNAILGKENNRLQSKLDSDENARQYLSYINQDRFKHLSVGEITDKYHQEYPKTSDEFNENDTWEYNLCQKVRWGTEDAQDDVIYFIRQFLNRIKRDETEELQSKLSLQQAQIEKFREALKHIIDRYRNNYSMEDVIDVAWEALQSLETNKP